MYRHLNAAVLMHLQTCSGKPLRTRRPRTKPNAVVSEFLANGLRLPCGYDHSALTPVVWSPMVFSVDGRCPVSHLDQNLIPGETLLYQTGRHWIVLVVPLILGVVFGLPGLGLLFGSEISNVGVF